MATSVSLVTGATGLLGSHLVERLLRDGVRVRALVRPDSDTAFLRGLGVELATADLADAVALPAAVAGAEVVYHCAARVSDWGPWSAFVASIVEPTRNLLAACRQVGVGRFVHVSSSRVYGHPRADRPVTEDDPLGQRLWRLWDYYPRAKIAAEELVRGHAGAWTIVRPTWIYGPRDRNTLPRLLHTLQLGQAGIIGRGDNPLGMVHAADVADGLVRAAGSARAAGRVYNLGAGESFTQRQLLDALAAALGRPPVTRRVPYGAAFALGMMVETVGKVLRVQRTLRITRHGVMLLGGTIRVSSERARQELGWLPRVDPEEGLRQAVAWQVAR